MEKIALYIITKLADYAFNKGLDWALKDNSTKQQKLAQVITEVVNEFAARHDSNVPEGKTPFYKSKEFLAELFIISIFYHKTNEQESDELKNLINKLPEVYVFNSATVRLFFSKFKEELNKHFELDEVIREYRNEKILHIILDVITGFSIHFEDLKEGQRKILEEIRRRIVVNDKWLTTPRSRPQSDIIGRKDVLEKVRANLLNGEVTQLLNGMGGVGKTTIAEVYVDKFKEEYKHIIWLNAVQGFKEALTSEVTLLKELGLEPGKPDEIFLHIMQKLANIKPKGLLVIDNAVEELTRYSSNLNSLNNWHVLITSRHKMELYNPIEIDFLSEPEAIKLFRKFSDRLSEDEIKEIVRFVGYHTLTIEILARTLKRKSWGAEKILKALPEDTRVNVDVDYSQQQRIEKIKTALTEIFRVSELTENQIWILKQFLALPTNESLSIDLLGMLVGSDSLEWCDEFEDEVIGLYECGFLLCNQTDFTYKLHAVLKEILTTELKPTIEDNRTLLENITALVSVDETKDDYTKKFPFIPLGESILNLYEFSEDEGITLLQNELGILLKNAGFYERAKVLHNKALEIALKNFGDDHPEVAVRQSNLALVYQALGDYEQARDLLKEALESDPKNLGADHPTVAVSQSNLALVYQDLGEYEKARDMLELALESDLKNLGKDHPTVAVRQSNLALVYKVLGEYEKAREYFQKTLEIFKIKYEINHPHIAQAQSNLALVYKDLGEYEKARDLLELALESDLKNLGKDHPEVAVRQSNLALVYKDLGEYEKAREFFQKTLDIFKLKYETSHPYIAQAQSNLAMVYKDLGEYEKARDLLELALESALKNFGADHPTVAIRFNNLGYVLVELKDYQNAFVCFINAYKIWKVKLGEQHPNTKNVMSMLNNFIPPEERDEFFSGLHAHFEEEIKNKGW